MATAAIELQPILLARALQLHNGRQADAEDLVSECYLVMILKPPSPTSTAQLRRWLRTVMQRRWISAWRRRKVEGLDEVALEDQLAVADLGGARWGGG